MEQIYYTQCPIGYGIGASNGFQIKRLSAGYPLAGDFRHLGLRAFLPGTRTLAPPALRFRRDGQVAEVAWLWPRSHEYETEGGRLWGRPGGQFAHGIRLDETEQRAIALWPAGLYGRPFWRRSDPEATRGRPPDALAIGPDDLIAPPRLAAVARLAAGIKAPQLALLLAAVAQAVREARTLFLIDDPGRLGPIIALLTFAFPEPMRVDLSFSTFHDRPEELPGFRIQGTTLSSRPNLAALRGLGIVAVLPTGQIEPRPDPPRWARLMADWIAQGEAGGEAAWDRTCRDRAPRALDSRRPEAAWDDDWLDHLVDFDRLTRPNQARPDGPGGWRALRDFTGWAVRHGLAEEWASARNPSWWAALAGRDAANPEARRALLALGGLGETWRLPGTDVSTLAASWGAVTTAWFGAVETDERARAVATLLAAAPAAGRARFLAALMQGFPPRAADDLLESLNRNPEVDPALLLPVRAVRIARVVKEAGDPLRLADLLQRAVAAPGATAAVLQAIADELGNRADLVDRVAENLAKALDGGDPLGRDAAWAWALRRDDALAWLGPATGRVFRHQDGPEHALRLRTRTPAPLRAALARVVLAVAARQDEPAERFPGCVDQFLLTLDQADQPRDPSWANTYLARVSGLDLARWLYVPSLKRRDLIAWLKGARLRKEIDQDQEQRIRTCKEFADFLEAGDVRRLTTINLPDVPPTGRGELLGEILDHVGTAAPERIDLCLNSLKHAWPSAFEPGAEGLAGLAVPLATALQPFLDDPKTWLDRLARMLDQVGQEPGSGRGFEPDGLAAEVVAATNGAVATEAVRWRLRTALLAQDDAWRILAIDARRAIASEPPGRAPQVVQAWDDAIDKRGDAARFFTLMLNACDGPALAAVVASRIDDLRTLGVVPWWDHPNHPGARDDIRDALGRLAPVAPLTGGILARVEAWMALKPRTAGGGFDDPGLEPLDEEEARAFAEDRSLAHLSERGRDRWGLIRELSLLRRHADQPAERGTIMARWFEQKRSLRPLEGDDLYRFLAEVIRVSTEDDVDRVPRLAAWLVNNGVAEVGRVRRWEEDLIDPVPDPLRSRSYEFANRLQKELSTLARELADQ